MTELDLYKYIQENNIEWHWSYNDGEKDVIIFPYFFQLEDLANKLSPCFFDDGGRKVTMFDNYVSIWMRDVCEYYGVDIEKVFDREKEN